MFPTGQQYTAMRAVIRAARQTLNNERDEYVRRCLSQDIANAVAYLDALYAAAIGARKAI